MQKEPQQSETPTPRTDKALLRYTGGELVTFPRGLNPTVDADFARSLELECASLTEKLDEEARRHDAAIERSAQNEERAESAESSLRNALSLLQECAEAPYIPVQIKRKIERCIDAARSQS